MKHAVPAPAHPDADHRPLPAWMLIPLGLLLLLLSAGCSREKLASILPKNLLPAPAPAKGLAEVLPGRWDIRSRGRHMTLQFGRHSEMSFTVDVPEQYRAQLNFDQFWVGGNYKVLGNEGLEVTMTDGRWAAILASMQGLKLHHVGVKQYTDDSVLDSDNDTWTRIGKDTAGGSGHEVRDIAGDVPATAGGGNAPAAPSAPAPASAAPAASANAADSRKIKAEHDRLATMYAKLEKRRRGLDPKDAGALAAFNKDAADYARQTARFSAQNKSGGLPTASPQGRPVAVENAPSAATATTTAAR